MSTQPTTDFIFQAHYSYYLEDMTERLNRRLDQSMNFLLLFLGAITAVSERFGWLCGILAALFSAYRVAYKPAQIATQAKAQKLRYARLLRDIPSLHSDQLCSRLLELEELDSSAPNILCNPARNRAAIALEREQESLGNVERLMAFLAGGIPQ